MRFIVLLLKAGHTVVYENIFMSQYWVFKSSDSYTKSCNGKLTKLNCNELNNPNTLHIFDSKCGLNIYEPSPSNAKLLFLSSTNDNIAKQSQKRVRFLDFILIIPPPRLKSRPCQRPCAIPLSLHYARMVQR